MIHPFKYAMSWSDPEIPQFFIIESCTQCMNSIQDVLQMRLFRKLVIILWYPLENRPNEIDRICGLKMLQ